MATCRLGSEPLDCSAKPGAQAEHLTHTRADRRIADDARRLEPGKLVLGDAQQLAQDLPIVLAEESLDGAIVLGIIERGETLHGLAIGLAVTRSIIDLQLETGLPIGLGIIGPGAGPLHVEPRLESHARDAVAAVASMAA